MTMITPSLHACRSTLEDPPGMPSALSASSTGAIRAISVSDETGAASGLLDAGPRSITSAPSAISLRACAMAASGARYRPPSEGTELEFTGRRFTTS